MEWIAGTIKAHGNATLVEHAAKRRDQAAKTLPCLSSSRRAGHLMRPKAGVAQGTRAVAASMRWLTNPGSIVAFNDAADDGAFQSYTSVALDQTTDAALSGVRGWESAALAGEVRNLQQLHAAKATKKTRAFIAYNARPTNRALTIVRGAVISLNEITAPTAIVSGIQREPTACSRKAHIQDEHCHVPSEMLRPNPPARHLESLRNSSTMAPDELDWLLLYRTEPASNAGRPGRNLPRPPLNIQLHKCIRPHQAHRASVPMHRTAAISFQLS
ncbi:hypothetical protein ACS5PN_00040 [Roseateles sp. NT4]|uniref:hypothetical protein n=1 Tax=Roseateles sp. NT4 TaxID=3453715 RepID=UPI003EEF19EF